MGGGCKTGLSNPMASGWREWTRAQPTLFLTFSALDMFIDVEPRVAYLTPRAQTRQSTVMWPDFLVFSRQVGKKFCARTHIVWGYITCNQERVTKARLSQLLIAHTSKYCFCSNKVRSRERQTLIHIRACLQSWRRERIVMYTTIKHFANDELTKLKLSVNKSLPEVILGYALVLKVSPFPASLFTCRILNKNQIDVQIARALPTSETQW